METLIIILAILAGVVGLVGSILPALPGPPLGWVGLLIIYIWGNGTNTVGDTISTNVLIVWGLVVVIVSVLDYIVPMYLTKATGGTRYAQRGAMVGLIVGIILTPVGMVLGSFIGAFLFELYYTRKDAGQALKAAFGSFLGFILGTGLKAIVSVIILWKIIVYAF